MNGDHLLRRAKEAVLELDAEGYLPPTTAPFPVAGPDGRAVLELTAYTMRNAGQASDYDLHLARKLAYVLTGGKLPAGTLVPEQYLLDLEREAFLSLCGQAKTHERMAHMLQRNRPLRN
jgi:3-hydroxyacyl-CoA dehydrogenase